MKGSPCVQNLVISYVWREWEQLGLKGVKTWRTLSPTEPIDGTPLIYRTKHSISNWKVKFNWIVNFEKKCKVYKENNYSLNQENDMKNYQFSAQRFENMKGSPGSFEESENAWASEVWKHEGLLYQQSPLITHLWSRGQDNQIHKLFQIHYQLLQFSSLL